MGASSFNEMEIDAIGEIMNISLGASATAVSTMLGTTVNITTPLVKVLGGEEFEFKNLEPAVGVEISYTQGLEGSNIMMFSRNDVRIIVSMLMGAEIPEDQFELDEINRSAICEVMNQMMGSSATALSEFLGMKVNISTPYSFEVDDAESFKGKYFPTEARKVVVRFHLEVEGRLKSEFLNIMSVDLVKRLLEPFAETFGQMKDSQDQKDASDAIQEEAQRRMAEEGREPESQEATGQEPMNQEPMSQEQQAQEQQIPQPQAQTMQPVYGTAAQPVYQVPDPMMFQILSQMQQSQMQMVEMMREMKSKEKQKNQEPSVIHPINSAPLEDDGENGVEDHANQEMLMKVPLEVSVEIGRTKKRVKDILEFTQGSLVVLDKMAGEQADLYVNGQCIARGDIVVVEDNFGIRITEIVSRNLNPESL